MTGEVAVLESHPEIAIAWPGDDEPILSGKDARPVAGAGAPPGFSLTTPTA
jgi:hypothetical protein